jgi:hypothetical protein
MTLLLGELSDVPILGELSDVPSAHSIPIFATLAPVASCCARAPSGHAAAALLSSVMKSRRFMSDLELRRWHLRAVST